MDIMLLALYISFAVACLAIDAYKKGFPYLAMLAGIVFILAGLTTFTSSGVSQSFCAYANSSSNMTCIDHPLPSFNIGTGNLELLGILLALIGAGVIVDSIVNTGERGNVWQPQGDD